MVYTVTFNPAVDYVVRPKTFDFGKVNRLTDEQVFVGGKGINVSIVLKELGVESSALGFVAGFTGEFIKKDLESRGIPTDFVELKDGFTRINVKIKYNGETEINGGGPGISPEELDEFFAKLKKLTSEDTIIVAGSIPPSLPENMYERILECVKDSGVRCIVDASGDLLMKVIKFKPFLIKPNHIELAEIFGRELNSDEDIRECAEKLRSMGASNVLVSMAENGSMLIDENGKCYRMGTAAGSVKNSVGAGDSMVAGFVAGYLKTGDFGYAVKLGTAAGGATAFSDGLGGKDHIMELFKELDN